jgi:hypothetical protein
LAQPGTSVPFAEGVTDTVNLCGVLTATIPTHLILLAPDALRVGEAAGLIEQSVLADELTSILAPLAVVVHHAELLIVDQSALLVAHHLGSVPHAFGVLGAVQSVIVPH